MVDLKLKTLHLENFKGIRNLEIAFADGTTSIYGDNATGKTTVYDALTWLLFGKDSSSSAKFTIKPVDVQGVTPTVTAVYSVNGEPLKLRKVLREKWSKPRGCAVAQYDGDTVEHFIDDVPRKESDYKRMIADIISEDLFRLLTNIHSFARDLPWKERRSQLAELCGLPDDTALLADAPQFAPLAEALGRRTIDEYKTALLTERKHINQTLDSLPVRMDECERQVRELAGLDFTAAAQQKVLLTEQRQAVQADLAKLDGNALLADTEATYKVLLAERKTLDAENDAHRNSQVVPVVDERPAIQAELSKMELQLENIKAEICRTRAAITQSEMRLDAYREQWEEIDHHTFKEKVCPTCGQMLPTKQMAQAKAKFEADKQRRKDNLVADSNLLKESTRQAQEAVQHQTEELKRKTKERDAIAQRLAAYKPPEALQIEDLPDYHTKVCALDLQIAEVQDRIHALQGGQAEERGRFMDKLAALDSELGQAERVLARKTLLEDTNVRLEQLHAEQRARGAQLEELDKNIALCEDFTRYKVQFLTDAVNSRFKLVQFRLFREQLNGGLADCCDVMVDGVPYADLNHAMQVNVGVDIIRTLSAHYGLHVPLVVDNAESVTKLQEIDTQVIRLVVSESDKELRIV